MSILPSFNQINLAHDVIFNIPTYSGFNITTDSELSEDTKVSTSVSFFPEKVYVIPNEMGKISYIRNNKNDIKISYLKSNSNGKI